MSIVSVYAALEEFTEEVNSEIATPTPVDGDFSQPLAGVNYETQSGDIDSDIAAITKSAQGLEDIISLIEQAPGAGDAPLDPFAEKATNLALESNELVASTGNPLATTADKGKTPTKDGALNKIKEVAQKVWDMLRNLGKRMATWIREIWAKYTDRIVKNANAAKNLLAQLERMSPKSGAKITDEALLAKVSTFKNGTVVDVVMAVSEHARDQGSKQSEDLTKQARSCIDVVANGAGNASDVMNQFLDVLAKSAGTYNSKASPAQAQATKAAAGTETYLSDPFFQGYRAWTTVPENAEALQHWNHGITKVDEVTPQKSIDAPDKDEIKAIIEVVIGMGSLVAVYQNNLKNLDILNKELDKAAGKAKSMESESGNLKQMQAVVPRIIKGPQVAAYGYAVSASTVALQYCAAAIAAHGAESKETAVATV